ncbi:uncharacterized protein IWZ02DRAFT_484758 [Phyllosticta citriasiana]|uniref:uncharacterized protein n=1 Tax=Phyllosticta citriasiana TaxID=595635 RepID=UPI0030FDE94C
MLLQYLLLLIFGEVSKTPHSTSWLGVAEIPAIDRSFGVSLAIPLVPGTSHDCKILLTVGCLPDRLSVEAFGFQMSVLYKRWAARKPQILCPFAPPTQAPSPRPSPANRRKPQPTRCPPWSGTQSKTTTKSPTSPATKTSHSGAPSPATTSSLLHRSVGEFIDKDLIPTRPNKVNSFTLSGTVVRDYNGAKTMITWVFGRERYNRALGDFLDWQARYARARLVLRVLVGEGLGWRLPIDGTAYFMYAFNCDFYDSDVATESNGWKSRSSSRG